MTGTSREKRNAQKKLSIWSGFFFCALCTYLALRNVDWNAFVESFRSVDVTLTCIGIILIALGQLLAGVRWRLLVSPSTSLRVLDACRIFMIGNLVNTVMPLRAGDVLRAALTGRRTSISAASALAAIMVEKMLDLSVILAMGTFMSFLIVIPQVIERMMLFTTVMVGLALATFTSLVMAKSKSVVPDWVRRFATTHPLITWLVSLMDRFTSGLLILRTPIPLLGALGLTAASWLIVGASFSLWILAFNLSIPWYAGLFTLVVVTLGTAIPSSPGWVGVYHYLAVIALSV